MKYAIIILLMISVLTTVSQQALSSDLNNSFNKTRHHHFFMEMNKDAIYSNDVVPNISYEYILTPTIGITAILPLIHTSSSRSTTKQFMYEGALKTISYKESESYKNYGLGVNLLHGETAHKFEYGVMFNLLHFTKTKESSVDEATAPQYLLNALQRIKSEYDVAEENPLKSINPSLSLRVGYRYFNPAKPWVARIGLLPLTNGKKIKATGSVSIGYAI